MEQLLHDIRFGMRVLWKDRTFTLTSILTLALCIGINAAIFGVVYSVLLRPLPVPESDRIALVYNSYPNAGAVRADTGVPDYYDRLRDVSAFEDQALYQERGQTVGTDTRPERLTGMRVTPSFFKLARTHPARGRLFTEREAEVGHDKQVIISDALWHRLFAGRDDALGRDFRVNGIAHTIVGVMPADFRFLSSDVQFWTPLAFSADDRSDESRHSNNFTMLGRLKPGATIQQAQSQIDALNAANMVRFPAFKQILINAGFKTVVVPLQEEIVGESDPRCTSSGAASSSCCSSAASTSRICRSCARASGRKSWRRAAPLAPAGCASHDSS